MKYEQPPSDKHAAAHSAGVEMFELNRTPGRTLHLAFALISVKLGLAATYWSADPFCRTAARAMVLSFDSLLDTNCKLLPSLVTAASTASLLCDSPSRLPAYGASCALRQLLHSATHQEATARTMDRLASRLLSDS